MLKIELTSARVQVRARFWGEGSILAETVETHCPGVETRLILESNASAARIAKLARLAEQGCYVIQSLRRPTDVFYEVLLNGAPIETARE